MGKIINRHYLEIFENEIFIIMGLSGSGKSTLARIIGMLEEPTKGKIWFKDKDLLQLSKKVLKAFRQEKIGLFFSIMACFHI